MSFDNNNNAGAHGAGAANDAGAGLLGTWQLDVKTPFGQHPATLNLARGAGGEIDGDIQSRLGNAALSGIRVDGETFEAAVTIHLQGREFSAGVTGRAAAGQMSGTIKVNMPGAPALKFTGAKQ